MQNEALRQLAEMMGCDWTEARAFCIRVQKYCRTIAPFSAIAQAVARSDLQQLSYQSIARLACQIHQGIAVEESGSHPPRNLKQSAPTEQPGVVITRALPTPQPEQDRAEPEAIEPEYGIADAVLPATATFIDAITRHALGTIFAESIEDQVIGFTGNGPFYETDLIALAVRLKAIPDTEGIAWERLDWVVVGSAEFDPEYLLHAAAQRQVRFFTQEEFLGVLIFGDQSLSPAASSWLQRTHDGIRFVEKVSQSDGADDPPVAATPITPATHERPEHHAPLVQAPPPSTHSVVPTPTMTRWPVPPAPVAKTPPPQESKPPGRVEPNPAFHQPPTRPRVDPANTTIPTDETTGGRGVSSPSLTPAVPANHERHYVTPDPNRASVIIPDVSTAPTPGSGNRDISKLNLKAESELKRLGYHVRKGGSRTHRKLALQKGVEQLGLQDVVDHLAFLIRFHRNSPNKRDAVFFWNEDLQWITKVYASRLRST